MQELYSTPFDKQESPTTAAIRWRFAARQYKFGQLLLHAILLDYISGALHSKVSPASAAD